MLASTGSMPLTAQCSAHLDAMSAAFVRYGGMSGQTGWANLAKAGNPVRTGRGLSAEIEEQILSGKLPPGSRLPSERQLSDWVKLSRPAVREALRDLAARGFLDVVPGRGAFVRDVSVADVARPLERLYWRKSTPREVVEARRMLESQAAELAAVRADSSDLAAMEKAIANFDASADPLLRARYDFAFHFAVVKAAHNPVVEAMYGSISRLTAEMILRSLADPNVTRMGVPYHRRILEAIRARDPNAARAEAAEHLRVAEQLYGNDLDSPLDDVARREARRLFGSALSLDNLLASIASLTEPETTSESSSQSTLDPTTTTSSRAADRAEGRDHG